MDVSNWTWDYDQEPMPHGHLNDKLTAGHMLPASLSTPVLEEQPKSNNRPNTSYPQPKHHHIPYLDPSSQPSINEVYNNSAPPSMTASPLSVSTMSNGTSYFTPEHRSASTSAPALALSSPGDFGPLSFSNAGLPGSPLHPNHHHDSSQSASYASHSQCITPPKSTISDAGSHGYANQQFATPQTTPLLHVAAHTGNCSVLQTLLKHGAAIDERDPEGRTALHVAAYQGHKAAVALLLRSGSDPNAYDVAGKSSVYLAVSGGHNDVVDLLLRYENAKRLNDV